MELTINVHVTGLDKLAEAILSLAKQASVQPNVPAPTADKVIVPSVNSAPTAPAPVSVPTAAPSAHTYTLEELARAGAALMSDPAKAPAVMALPAQFGVKTLQELPAERYGELATALRGLGANV